MTTNKTRIFHVHWRGQDMGTIIFDRSISYKKMPPLMRSLFHQVWTLLKENGVKHYGDFYIAEGKKIDDSYLVPTFLSIMNKKGYQFKSRCTIDS
jgi:hypothetical protein